MQPRPAFRSPSCMPGQSLYPQESMAWVIESPSAAILAGSGGAAASAPVAPAATSARAARVARRVLRSERFDMGDTFVRSARTERGSAC